MVLMKHLSLKILMAVYHENDCKAIEKIIPVETGTAIMIDVDCVRQDQ